MVRKINNLLFTKLKALRWVIILILSTPLDNWWTYILFRLRVVKGPIPLMFTYNHTKLSFSSGSPSQSTNNIGMINEQFFNEQYKWLDVKGRTVVDVGANIGDTAIYFAVNGASHVYSFEPYPYSYNQAKRNIKMNGIKNITLLNVGCGKRGRITIDPKFANAGGSDLHPSKKGVTVRIRSLADIVRSYGMYDPVLKVDCEGCEYPLLLGASNADLQKFSRMQIEYHYGYESLVKKLAAAGFAVRHTEPKHAFNQFASDPYMSTGMIYAERRPG